MYNFTKAISQYFNQLPIQLTIHSTAIHEKIIISDKFRYRLLKAIQENRDKTKILVIDKDIGVKITLHQHVSIPS